MSKEVLIEKIKSDAENEAKRILDDARAKIESNRAEIEARLDREEAEAIERANRQIDEKVKQVEMIADIESRKIMLKAKREIIDLVIARARQKILNLSDADYIEWIGRLIRSKADDGDEVVVSSIDRNRITADVISVLSEKTGKKVTLSSEIGDFDGGIKLYRNGCYKVLTLNTVLDEIKQERIAKISNKLFNDVE